MRHGTLSKELILTLKLINNPLLTNKTMKRLKIILGIIVALAVTVKCGVSFSELNALLLKLKRIKKGDDVPNEHYIKVPKLK